MPVIELLQKLWRKRGTSSYNTPLSKSARDLARSNFGTPPTGRLPQADDFRDVFEDGTGKRLGKESFIKDLGHLLCPTCLQDCTQSTDTIYSSILPGNPCFVLLPPKPCCKQVPISLIFDSAADVAQQQDDRRLNNASWKKPLCHKQRLGVLDDVWVEALAFYRSRAGNMRSAFSKTLGARPCRQQIRSIAHPRSC